ncbi:Asp-tRNA(Asn)/Glu-tRNA(Gln) amidotransferase subunit GatC [Vampirovibrio chlorellavorus]|uniref:Asp-tRNA(Asn)/Glu-tRNA(Gln) amidotransferase subunit GatC n=1 Tax=Vampirovibrio chlorellavorus TaxID=758823 RepID=UPI0026EA3C7B|nr:Asp-tRNA(Asn)/Glu-tRNA(Gln) amidotransferase subunit GatC [Vampirovibrio chlorellavorus]
MTISQETVQHVAKLARLELTPEESERYTQDLGKILTLVEELNQVDLSQIELGMDASTPTVFRADQAVREFSREELMANAPHEEDGFFRVPKILGDSAG